uniref:Uncharacterized protein LOC111133270 n=1 Tax=Crassostrea virginica TaxID=6565 RepID=A0A8B8EC91_CRAVI|nr:uncharacterized protein LOC111133270 [Crassostrea virginica]
MNSLVLGALIAVIPSVLAIFGNYRCTVTIRGFIPKGEYDEHTAPPDCLDGSIRWNYPMEFAIVHFTPDVPENFSVCFGEPTSGSFFKFHVYDITSGRPQEEVPFNKGTQPCLEPLNGTVSIEIKAPEALTYLWLVKYYINVQ